ncbi:MAG TPA: hypothetical protein VNW46_14375 [Gemmatimonadaceae bacterium]|jgi:hypothetical protein|nr:hypothetical protein [Gemmatimonadaceae bacterium]
MTSSAEARIQWHTVGTRPLLLIDLSHATDHAETLAAVAYARQLVPTHAPARILTMTDVTAIRYNADILQAIREMADHNTPYVEWGAVIGLSALLRSIYKLARRTSGRTNLRTFDTREEGLAWLASITSESNVPR